MKKGLVLTFFILLVVLILVLITGSAITHSHAYAEEVYFDREDRATINSAGIADAAYANWQAFIDMRYIVVTNDAGEEEWVEVANEFGRNSYSYNGTLLEQNGYRYYAPGGAIQSQIGIDVSKYQGTIDWAQVKSAGIQFAFIRVGYRGYGNGKLVVDDTFVDNIEGAIEAGIPVGVYFFTQATTYEEGAEEARFVLEQISPYNVTLPIVLDTEETTDDAARAQNLTKEERTNACLGFMETIRGAGKEPMLYANRQWIALDLDMARFAGYKLWYAQYADVPKIQYMYQYWQYSANGYVPGVPKEVDMNIYYIPQVAE